MFQLVCTVLESDRKPEGNTLILGIPDAAGTIIKQPFDDGDEEVLHLKPGTQLSLQMVPFVKSGALYASETTPNAAGLVPVDHPAIVSPESAAASDAVSPEEVSEATPASDT